MGILKEHKYDWTETLYAGYQYNEKTEEYDFDDRGYCLLNMPYYGRYDYTKNGKKRILMRNVFYDNNFFDDSTTSICELDNERI